MFRFWGILRPGFPPIPNFCIHEKAVQLISKGTGLISTFIFDEDPMKSLFKIDQIHLEDVKTVIARVANSETTMPEVERHLWQNCIQ